MPPILHTHLANTHSTNSQLIDWIILSYQEQSPLEHERPHYSRPHLLTTDTQSNGRGQHGRTWQSPLGNVYLSLYIPSAQFAQSDSIQLQQRLDGRFSLCVGYQLAKLPVVQHINIARQNQGLAPIGVKWVNDLGFYDKQTFQKLAGILIEPVSIMGKMLGIVIGVGVNIAKAPTLTTQTQEGLNYQAISFHDLLEGEKFNLSAYQSYFPMIEQAICQAVLQFNGFDEEKNIQDFVYNFSQVDVLRNKTLIINSPLPDKAVITGTANGIDSNGSLQILEDDGRITPVWTGTIQVL